MQRRPLFFFNDTATTEIYTLSLHDALPICRDHHAVAPRAERLATHASGEAHAVPPDLAGGGQRLHPPELPDRKSTRLNSSHANISYAVFCLKKKKKTTYRSYKELIYNIYYD